MKKHLLLFLACVLLFSFTSCNMIRSDTEYYSDNPIKDAAEKYDQSELEKLAEEKKLAEWTDRDISHMPTSSEIKTIKTGMTASEIVDILGKPHEVSELSYAPSMTWYTESDLILRVGLNIPSDAPNMHYIDRMMLYGVACLLTISAEPTDEVVNTYDKLTEIKLGMTPDEVYAVVGRPQYIDLRILPYNHTSSLGSLQQCEIYDSIDGSSVFVVYGYEDDRDYRVVVYTMSADSSFGELTQKKEDNELMSLEEFSVIKEGMTRPEVYAIAGKPQRVENRILPANDFISAAIPTLCEIYDTSDGKCMILKYGYNENFDREILLRVIFENSAIDKAEELDTNVPNEDFFYDEMTSERTNTDME